MDFHIVKKQCTCSLKVLLFIDVWRGQGIFGVKKVLFALQMSVFIWEIGDDCCLAVEFL